MFSVVIPIGPNRDARHALGSLLQSGLTEADEVLLIGDGFTPAISEEFKCLPITLHTTHGALGANVARNLGAEKATQPYLCFLDDDDEYLPGALTQLRMTLLSRPSLAVCSLSWKMLSGRLMPNKRVKKQFTENDIWKRNIAGGCSSMVLKKSAFEDVDGFDPDMKSMQDWDLWIRLSRQFPINIIVEPHILYRDHDGARISTNRTRKIAGLMRLLEKNMSSWPNRVCAFHRARIASLRFVAGEVSWFSIFQPKAPLASMVFAFKVLFR